MTTRAARLAHAAEVAQAKLAADRRDLAAIQAAQRQHARKARDKRRYRVGTWCDEAELLDCDEALLQEMFALCRCIAASATPGAMVAACQALVSGAPGTSVEGRAETPSRVSATHSA